MPTYAATPGTLNLAMRAGDDFSALIDFSVSLTAYTMTSSIQSVVTGGQVEAFTTTLSDAAAGKVNIALTDTQTSAIPTGTYRWTLAGTQGSLTRTYLEGYVEVTR